MKTVNNVENSANVEVNDTHKRILDTALKLFIQNGYLNTKIVDIANSAGIGKGTIYGYFNSKESLFTELLKIYVVDHYSEMIETITAGDASSREQLQRYIRFDSEIAQRLGNGKNFIDQLFYETRLIQNDDLKNLLNRFMNCRLSTLHSIITVGQERGEFAPVDPMTATISIMGAIGAFISQRCGILSESNHSIPDAHDYLPDESLNDEATFLELLLHGLASKG